MAIGALGNLSAEMDDVSKVHARRFQLTLELETLLQTGLVAQKNAMMAPTDSAVR